MRPSRSPTRTRHPAPAGPELLAPDQDPRRELGHVRGPGSLDHVAGDASALRGGASLVHGVQAHNSVGKVSM